MDNPQTPARMQAQVTYFPGVTVAGQQYGILEWSADDHIRLFLMDADTNQATSVVFDTTVGGIEKVGGSVATLTFTINGKKYRVEFSEAARMSLAGAGVAGLVASAEFTKRSGIAVWLDALQKAGVRVTFIKMRRIMLWSVLGTIALIAIIVAVVIATSGTDS